MRRQNLFPSLPYKTQTNQFKFIECAQLNTNSNELSLQIFSLLGSARISLYIHMSNKFSSFCRLHRDNLQISSSLVGLKRFSFNCNWNSCYEKRVEEMFSSFCVSQSGFGFKKISRTRITRHGQSEYRMYIVLYMLPYLCTNTSAREVYTREKKT